VDYLIHCDQCRRTYEVVRALRDLDIRQIVAEAWRQAREEEKDKWLFAPIAVSHGVAGALEFLIDHLDDQAGFHMALMDPEIFGGRPHRPLEFARRGGFFELRESLEPRKVVLRYIEFRGTNAQIKQWFQEHKDRLLFDAQRQLFVVGPAAV
jgi:hypothetical protein